MRLGEERPASLTDTEKARLVWKAARIKNARQLDDETAAELGDKLARAVEYYRIAETPRPPRERERLEQIERAAEKLARLLAESSRTRDRLEEFWPVHFGGINMHQARLGIASIRKAARRARIVETPTETVHRKGGSAALRSLFRSPQQLFIRLAASAYEKASGTKARVSRNNLGELSGPFVRFTQEAATQFGLSEPSAETIKVALHERNMGDARRKNRTAGPLSRR